jgi:hypothetical protein
MEGDSFYLDTLQCQSQYPQLLKRVKDETILDEIAEQLTHVSQVHMVTRASLLLSLGDVSVKRQRAVEDVLRHYVGDKFEYKVIYAGPDFEKGGVFTRLVGCFFAPLPMLWVRISVEK